MFKSPSISTFETLHILLPTLVQIYGQFCESVLPFLLMLLYCISKLVVPASHLPIGILVLLLGAVISLYVESRNQTHVDRLEQQALIPAEPCFLPW